jgi:CspA family cold shock protein
VIYGTVLNFNEEKKYGFIRRDDGARDVFVHIHALKRAGVDSLVAGQRIEFDVEPDRRDPSGQKLRVSSLQIVEAA